MAQIAGNVCLFPGFDFDTMVRNELLQEEAKIAADFLKHALPTRLAYSHSCYCYETRNRDPQYQQHRGFADLVLPLLLSSIGRFFAEKVVIHNSDTVTSLVRELDHYGIGRESIPPYMVCISIFFYRMCSITRSDNTTTTSTPFLNL